VKCVDRLWRLGKVAPILGPENIWRALRIAKVAEWAHLGDNLRRSRAFYIFTMFAQDVPTMSFSLDDPPNSRLFVVAGRNTSVSCCLAPNLMTQMQRLRMSHPCLNLLHCSLTSSGVCLSSMGRYHSLNICVTKVSTMRGVSLRVGD
jgi:hypothetical protein